MVAPPSILLVKSLFHKSTKFSVSSEGVFLSFLIAFAAVVVALRLNASATNHAFDITSCHVQPPHIPLRAGGAGVSRGGVLGGGGGVRCCRSERTKQTR